MQACRLLRCCRRLSSDFLLSTGKRHVLITPVVNYKSQYSLDNLYPNSNRDFVSNPGADLISKQASKHEEFSGLIPVDKITISHSRSSGPGGQNVNKVNTKVEIRFHLASAEWIPAWIRERLLQKERSRITKDGMLIVTSEKTRKQLLNQADCMDKIRTMIFNCSTLPHEPTEEEVTLKESRIQKAKRGILLEKRQHSMKKQTRQSPAVGHV